MIDTAVTVPRSAIVQSTNDDNNEYLLSSADEVHRPNSYFMYLHGTCLTPHYILYCRVLTKSFFPGIL